MHVTLTYNIYLLSVDCTRICVLCAYVDVQSHVRTQHTYALSAQDNQVRGICNLKHVE